MSSKQLLRRLQVPSIRIDKAINNALHDVLEGDLAISDELLEEFAELVKAATKRAFTPRARKSRLIEKKLYVTDIGRPCLRQLWFDFYESNKKAPITPAAKLKFFYGDLIEEIVLMLAKMGGCHVSSAQKRVSMPLPDGWTLSGRIDALIDGKMVTDVKSTTGFGFKKFKDGTLEGNDAFGYMAQLSTYAYLLGLDKVEASFLAVDRAMGHVCEYVITPEQIERHRVKPGRISQVLECVTNTSPPERAFAPVPDGKAGNQSLCPNCSYCGYNDVCWADANDGAGLRTFLYGGGKITKLVKVVKEPRVPEYK